MTSIDCVPGVERSMLSGAKFLSGMAVLCCAPVPLESRLIGAGIMARKGKVSGQAAMQYVANTGIIAHRITRSCPVP